MRKSLVPGREWVRERVDNGKIREVMESPWRDR